MVGWWDWAVDVLRRGGTGARRVRGGVVPCGAIQRLVRTLAPPRASNLNLNSSIFPSMSETLTHPVVGSAQDPLQELRRIRSVRSPRTEVEESGGDAGVAALLSSWAEDGVVCPPGSFQLEGDAVLLLGDSGGGAEGDGEAGAVLRTTLAGLVLEGVIRSARTCGEGGMLLTMVDSLPPGTAGTEAGKGVGVVVQWTAADPAVPLEKLLFGESPNRVVVSVRGEDAGRVLKQAKILGVPGVRVGTVGGEGLVVRFGEQEWREPVLPDGNGLS